MQHSLLHVILLATALSVGQRPDEMNKFVEAGWQLCDTIGVFLEFGRMDSF